MTTTKNDIPPISKNSQFAPAPRISPSTGPSFPAATSKAVIAPQKEAAGATIKAERSLAQLTKISPSVDKLQKLREMIGSKKEPDYLPEQYPRIQRFAQFNSED